MKKLRNILRTAFVVAFVVLLYSCSSNADDYLKFVDNGAISYTGKLDSLKILSGRNRVKVQGLVISDPKVSELRVYWNTKKDSVVFPINRTSGVDVVSNIIENLPENIYNFEVKTFDAKGNSSVSQFVNVQTYDARYQASLTDRKISASKLSVDFSLTVEFLPIDLTNGAYASEIVYTDGADVERNFTVLATESKAVIPNYKKGTKFKIRTVYLPKADAIDMFYTEFIIKDPMVVDLSYLIMNNKSPFVASSVDGNRRWGILANWITNNAIKNHGSFGPVDNNTNPNLINIECGWGSPDIVNGKVYQTVTLEPGVYVFKVNMLPDGSGVNAAWNTSDNAYLTVTTGTTLADSNLGVLETNPLTLGFKKLISSMAPDQGKFTFTVTENQQVSLGLSTTIFANGGGKWGKILSFQLLKNNN